MELDRPALMISPTVALTDEERDEFANMADAIRDVGDGGVVACPFPVALHHRIDGVWIPVTDLCDFHDSSPAPAPRKEPAESTYVPPLQFEPCDGDD